MAGGAFARQLREGCVFFRRQRQVIVILLENGRDELFFFRRVKGARGNLVDVDGFFIQLPGNQVTIPDAIEPGLLPSHEAVGHQFAGQIRILRRQKLRLSQRHDVSNGPRRKNHQAAQDHGQTNPEPAPVYSPHKKHYAEHDGSSDKQHRCFGTE